MALSAFVENAADDHFVQRGHGNSARRYLATDVFRAFTMRSGRRSQLVAVFFESTAHHSGYRRRFLFSSLTQHEMSHSYFSRRKGDRKPALCGARPIKV